MATMEQLGAKRKRLLAELAAVESELVPLMKAARADGATWMAILSASGYGSIEGVKKIVMPGRRDAANEAARGRRRADDGRATAGRVILTEDAAEASIVGSGWAQGS